MGTRLRREGTEGSEGKVDGLSGDEYIVSVTGLAFFVICLDRQSADWLTAFAPYPAAPDFHLCRGQNRLHYAFL